MKTLAFVILTASLAVPALAASGADGGQASKPKKERQICRQDEDTTSRMGSKRVCKTAAEWRVLDHGGSTADLAKAGAAAGQ